MELVSGIWAAYMPSLVLPNACLSHFSSNTPSFTHRRPAWQLGEQTWEHFHISFPRPLQEEFFLQESKAGLKAKAQFLLTVPFNTFSSSNRSQCPTTGQHP